MQTKAKKWPPSQTRVADRVRGPIWRGTWLIGQAHETEGSYPPLVARRWAGRDVYSPRPCVAAPDLGPLAWSASSLRRSLHGRAGLHPTAGSAVPPVRASSDRPLAGPRAQDQDDDDSHDPPPTTTELDLTITFSTHDQPTTNTQHS